jgi:hypothetical protein
MSHPAATFQSVFDKTVTAYDFVCAMADRVYWLDDTCVQPFYAWAAPRLRDVAISGLFWGLIALIDIALWLADTARQFMARDAQAIALGAFAQAHEPLPEFPALCPAAVPLALSPIMLSIAPLPTMMLPIPPAPEVLGIASDVASAQVLCPAVVPSKFGQFLQPDHSIRSWLTSALPLVLAKMADVPVGQVVTSAQPRKAKTPRKRSPKIKTARAQ